MLSFEIDEGVVIAGNEDDFALEEFEQQGEHFLGGFELGLLILIGSVVIDVRNIATD